MILVVEDNEDVSKMIKTTLHAAGFQTDQSFTGMDAMDKLKANTYELILLDMMLPFKSGDSILKELRTFSDTPVIVISAKDTVTTKIDMLRLGADDYITKPFDLEEMVARILSTLRRTKTIGREKETLNWRKLTLEERSKQVTVNGSLVELTQKEYMILELLMKHKGQVFTKAHLYETIWAEEYLGDDNAIKTHISNLRCKLKAKDNTYDYIETVWGLGYRFNTKE